jgi:hypothetical protein
MLLSSSDISARGEISDNLLAHPAPIEDPRPGIGETPLQVWDNAIVRRLLAEIVRILGIQLRVCSSYKRAMRWNTARTESVDTYLELARLSHLHQLARPAEIGRRA